MNTLSSKSFARRHRLTPNKRMHGSRFLCRPRRFLGLFESADQGDDSFQFGVNILYFDDFPKLASKLGMVYLAAPYTSVDKALEAKRAKAITWVAAQLVQRGLLVYSPIDHTRAMANVQGFPANEAFFDQVSKDFLARCDTLVVLLLKGWRESHGVGVEIDEAVRTGTPIYFLEVR